MLLVWLVSRRYCDSIQVYEVLDLCSTGFNYRFDALNPKGKENELVTAFNQMFDPQVRITFMMILRNIFPILNIFVRRPLQSLGRSFV